MLFRKKPTVVFMYADRYRYSGSTVMRGEQLMTIVKKRYGARYSFRYKSLSTKFRGATIFLTKGAVTDVTVDQLRELRERHNTVLLDPVDNPLDPAKAAEASAVIAASLQAYDEYRQLGYRSHLVNHHVDIRLPRQPGSKLEGLRFGYFGELVNTIQTAKIAKVVDFVHVDTGKQTPDWLSKPCQYNLHYAVRSDNIEAHKPFLKGFTAAACNANIVIQKDQIEAVRWLGSDYPYLLEPQPTEQDILTMLEYVRQSYGSQEWQRGLQIMNEIRQRTSDEAVATEFIAAVESTNAH